MILTVPVFVLFTFAVPAVTVQAFSDLLSCFPCNKFCNLVIKVIS